MGRVNNKVALVTGGASGVGKETVELLLKEGAYVAFGDIDVQAGEALAKACGERALFLRHDVSNEAEWQEVIAKVQAHFGPLDILINNAGILLPGSIETATLAQFRQLMQVNADSCFLGCQQGIAAMKERGGSIVNMASVSTWLPIEGYAGYSASKGGVAQLTKSLAIAYADDGIRVNAVAPGWIATPLTQALQDDPLRAAPILARTPMKRWGTPADVAGPVLFLASLQAQFVTGVVLPVDGGYLIS